MQLVIVSDSECERLFAAQATQWQGQAIGVHGVLPVTAEMREALANPTANGLHHANRPLWVQRTASPSQVEGILYVDASLPMFAGHFPGNPILPGVVQIDWAIEAAGDAFTSTSAAAFRGMSRIKFKTPVRPGTWLQLRLTRQGNDVNFVYLDNRGACTEGKLHYHD